MRYNSGREAFLPFKATLLAIGLIVAGAGSAVAQDAARLRAAADLGTAKVGVPLSVDLARVPSMVAEPFTPAFQPLRPRSGVSDEEYLRRKTLATKQAATTLARPAPAPSGGRIGRETPGTTVQFNAQSEAGLTPSDMAIAVSPSYVVQVVNSAIAVYNKSGVLQTGFPKTLKGLFPASTGDVGDPRAFYDWGAGRFVVVADDFSGGAIWLAASQTNNPTGKWNLYHFNVWGAANCRSGGSTCADFPQVGFSDSTILLGVNVFLSSGGVSDYVLLLPKKTIFAGGGFGFNFWFNLTIGGVNVDTVHPVTLVTAGEHPRAGFGVGSFNINFGGGQCFNGCSGMTFWAFSNNLQNPGSPGPELSAVTIPTANSYRLPALANEPNCSGCIDTGDVRISGTPTYHAGVISASLNTNGADALSHVLWFQAIPTLNDNDPRCTGTFLNGCPQITAARLINEDCYFCGGQGAAGATYYGTLAPDFAGDLTMSFNYSDTSTYPESAYTSRRVTQAINTMHDSGIVLCRGDGLYTQGRWGDYTGAVADPTNPAQGYMWFSGMNSLSNGNWGTCIGENAFTGTQP